MHGRLLWWSLRGRRGRHALNAAIMCITVAIVMVFVSAFAELARVVRATRNTELTRGLLFPKVIRGGMPMALYSTLADTEGVVYAHRFRAFGGRHDSGVSYLVQGEEDASPEQMLDVFPTPPDVIEAWKKEKPMGALVTEAVATALGLNVGDQKEVPTALGPLRIKVVGITKGAAVAHSIRVHFDYVKDLGNAGTCNFRIYTKPGDFKRVAKAIQEKTENSASPVIVVSAASWFSRWVESAAAIPAVLGFLGLFLILTTLLTLANTAAISMRERQTETATMRVLGYHRGTIVGMLTGESIIVGVIGGVVAVIVTWFVFRNGIQLTPGLNELKPITIGVPGMIAGAITSILVPLVGSLPSAFAGARVPLVTALRDTA